MGTMQRLTEIFRTVFDDNEIQLRAETTANDVDGWDSLTHVNLIVAVEKAFAVKFSQKELVGLKNVGSLAKLIEEKRGASFA